jgi:hypothetical protein
MMMKLTDEELQKLLESKSFSHASLDVNEDAKLYELVFEELSKEPDYVLPEGFSYTVTEKIWQQHRRKSLITPNAVLFASILAALLISAGTILYINAAMLVDVLTVLIQFKWIILFSLMVLILIEIGDRFLIRRRLS